MHISTHKYTEEILWVTRDYTIQVKFFYSVLFCDMSPLHFLSPSFCCNVLQQTRVFRVYVNALSTYSS